MGRGRASRRPARCDEVPWEAAVAHGLPGSYVAASQCGPCSQEGRLEAIESLARRVVEGHDVRLSCHCFPRACHGGVV